jgi:LysM repeat protein
MTVLSAGVRGPSGRASHYAAPVLLMALAAVIAGIVLTDPFRSSTNRHAATYAVVRKLPPYWSVRDGDTLAQISVDTGLSVTQLETFNPNVDPNSLLPGTRLNLWRHPPVPLPPLPGPMFWTILPGQSFGSVANATGVNMMTLEALNPKIKPTSVQPGQRLRLRQGVIDRTAMTQISDPAPRESLLAGWKISAMERAGRTRPGHQTWLCDGCYGGGGGDR